MIHIKTVSNKHPFNFKTLCTGEQAQGEDLIVTHARDLYRQNTLGKYSSCPDCYDVMRAICEKPMVLQ